MLKKYFDYENNYEKLQDKIKELKKLSEQLDYNLDGEIEKLERQMENIRHSKYRNLSPWEKVLLSRHPERPVVREYIDFLLDDFIEFHGDRLYGDDKAVIAGVGSFEGHALTVLAHQKGKGTNEKIAHHFGMPHPEGYRKVERLLLQSEKFKRPVLNLIDTPGAFPGVGAEERGQASSIARVLMTLSDLKVPVISIVTGEGGSGGALALGVCDRLFMLANSVFSVISAEACASIIFKETEKTQEMAAALKLTAQDLFELGIADGIIPEPVGGAHLDFDATALNIAECIRKNLQELTTVDMNRLLTERYNKIRSIGQYTESISNF
ncbi:MAG: acetyl-CoA carboxylase carboxyltransferase subunit alpha [Syntrophomonadaceae bacterium]|jgi:acetyl-CoA carboxylase carboxyl transferase subunit alpha|nr:acetyl-CoA carboxylase carboxyltransferase subunit alpha [Syntrophomonadaceae bacterium]